MENIQEEWLEKAIFERHINSIDYNKFTNPIVIGEGAITKVSYHPNIITFYGVTKDNYENYNMILEYANEGTLREYLKTGFTKLEWTDRLYIAKEIAHGLLFLHENNIIHRDLHSKNILIHQRQPKITDFGLSKQIDEITSNSNAHGMPAYVEPQCLVNDKYRRNMKSDVYSLGVILWEISSGRPPFPSFESVLSLAVYISKGNREEPIEDTPLQYIKLYKQCWDNDPADRPETCLIFNTLKQINLNETLSQYHSIEISEQFFKNLRKEAHEFFEQGKFLKSLELFEEVLKNCQLSPEDQVSATDWDLSCNRGSENLNELIMALRKNTTLTSSNLGSNELGILGGRLLSEVLCKNTTLTSLILKDNNLGSKGGKILSEGGKALASALCKNTTLTSLNLENNNLGSEALCKNTTLKNLDIRDNNLMGGEAIVDALCKNTTLTSLDLCGNGLGSKEVKILLGLLWKIFTGASLDLSRNELGSEGGKAFSDALCKNPSLTELKFQKNNLGSEGGKALVDALCKNSTLTSLDLDYNELGSEGGNALADALCKNSTLTSLNLQNNNLGSEGGKALADALCKNSMLTSLNLWINNLGSEGGKALADALCKNSTLTSLNLRGNALAKALCKNSTLKDLNLEYNNLGSEEGKAFVDALCKSFTLENLKIYDSNKIGFKLISNNSYLKIE
ncbi:hypothetical protein C2G38_2163676 [Gigaspora rosea]|uniref:Protein kinase domain-containing protein n=1 Tax=Gigaspora rosea TaxID=44941 RepID=A0A397VWZ0_9GLOM|nr:hypothetical protein C2G38_2163676 [Gigaspora rosea]